MMIRNRAGLVSTLVIVAAASIVRLGSLEAGLEYRVAEIASGDWWRVATSHLTHWSNEQFLWDCLTLFVLGVAFDRVAGAEPGRLAGAIAGSALAIPAALFTLQPGLEIYRGLSGIDSALFVLVGTLALARSVSRAERLVIGLALLGFVAKTIVEVATGGALFVQDLGSNVVAVPLAHAAGALAGFLAAVSDGDFIRGGRESRARARARVALSDESGVVIL